MAVSTAVSNPRPHHRSARLGDNAHHALALDWANGQSIALSGSSQQSDVFDDVNDCIVMLSVGAASAVLGEAFISVGANPTASATVAGSLAISAPIEIYVPAGMVIAAIQGSSGTTLFMIPALFTGN